jgi:hypothetical protein
MIKFHGKPVKILPLTYSINPNNRENKKKALIKFLKLKIKNKRVTKPKNKAKKAGIVTRAIGINKLKL